MMMMMLMRVILFKICTIGDIFEVHDVLIIVSVHISR
jgi:hypothetical protein